jgi:hypothetical protein
MAADFRLVLKRWEDQGYEWDAGFETGMARP